MATRMQFEERTREPWMEEMDGLFHSLENLDMVQENPVFLDEVSKLRIRFRDKNFRMAVVGEFSAGKSTFLNALIGMDLLKHGARETTATITEIQNTPQEQNRFRVHYANGTQGEDLPFADLEQYTTTSSTQFDVSKTVERVVIQCHMFDADYPVCLLDTPGLNGVADNHRETTVAEIKKAHACIYLLQVRGIGKSDVAFLRQLCAHQKNFIFVQNFIDELQALEGETPEGKLQQQSEILKEKVFYDMADIDYVVVGVSSRNALIARCPSVTHFENLPLTAERREALLAESRFQDVLTAVKDLAQRNQREHLQQLATVQSAIGWMKNLQALLQNQQLRLQAQWENSPQARSQAGYQKLRDVVVANQAETLKKLHNFVETNLINGESMAKAQLEQCLQDSLEQIKSKIGNFQTMDELEEFVQSGELAADIAQRLDAVEGENLQLLHNVFEHLLGNAILRITEYTSAEVPIQSVETMEELSFPELARYGDFQAQESMVERLQKKQGEAKASVQVLDALILQDKAQEASLSRQKQQIASVVASQEQAKSNAVRQLGEQPRPEQKTRWDSYEVYRNGFFKAIFGPKMVHREVTYLDKTALNAWMKQKNEVEQRFNKDILAQQTMQNRLELDLRKTRAQQQDRAMQKELEEKRAHGLEQQLATKIREVKLKKDLLQREYLAKMKTHTVEQVAQYFWGDGGAKSISLSNITAMVEANRPILWKKIEGIYHLALQNRLAMLDEKINMQSTSNAWKQMGQSLQAMVEIREKMEAILCNSL